MRLRPDPGATQLALSTEAGLTYYESYGQNWERAALIKARIIAGDRALGEEFLDELRGSSVLDTSHKVLLREFLGHCDLVKFAEVRPSVDEIRGTVGSCRDFIMATKKEQGGADEV